MSWESLADTDYSTQPEGASMMDQGSGDTTSPSDRVANRLVFYFSGFDPRGPSQYRKLYETEAELQSRVNSLNLKIGKRRKLHSLAHGWTIEHSETGTTTDYRFLRWDDVIRDNWPKNELELLKAAGPTYWIFIKENLIPRLLKIAWPAAVTVSYPLVAFFGLFVVGFCLAGAIAMLPTVTTFSLWLALSMASCVLLGTFYLSRFLDTKFRSHWLLRIYAMMQPWAAGKRPKMDERLKEFAQYLLDEIEKSDADEVLLVGHSVGTILTVSLVTEMLKLDSNLGQKGQDFCLVGLGNCIPLVSLLSGSQRLRDDLKTVATAPGVQWYDFSARRDGASVTQIDPLEVSGVSRPEGIPRRPQQYPVRIHKMFSPKKYEIIKKDIFRIHFQYVMAGEQQTDYDFFAITGGPIKLSARYPVASSNS
ncbi:MAG: hypothetical protein AB8D78_10560 [Akkermansiaceae bacterium]